jgi:hypothetical protein
MLLYMSHTNCQYLYLSSDQATKGQGFVSWDNIPSMSQSTRQCYITAVRLNVVFTLAAPQSHSDIIVKTPSIATMNYTATDNGEPLLAVLSSSNSIFFDLPTENPIHLLSNDNIKSFKLTLLQTEETATSTPVACNVLLKFEYVDQAKETENYLSGIPKHLGGL